MILAKLYIFLWRDWKQLCSYRFAFVLSNFGLFVPLVMLVFIERMMNGLSVPSVERYGGDYVAFALVGIVVTTYSGTALRAFSANLRASQSLGTLEVLFLTRANLYTIVFGWSLFPFLRSTVVLLVYFLGGFLILGLQLNSANFIGLALTLVLTVITMASLGILAAAFTLVFKQGEPFTRLIVLSSALLSGAVYPVQVLPEWLQAVSKLLPQTYAIEAARLFLLQGYSVAELLPELSTLLLFGLILLPLSLFIFHFAMSRARMEGSLAHY